MLVFRLPPPYAGAQAQVPAQAKEVDASTLELSFPSLPSSYCKIRLVLIEELNAGTARTQTSRQSGIAQYCDKLDARSSKGIIPSRISVLLSVLLISNPAQKQNRGLQHSLYDTLGRM
jgi:hypothetical protein